jgi:hypothetical protein
MFRFTIRDVLWLTVVVALATGWGIEHCRMAGLMAELAEYRRRDEIAARQAAEGRALFEKVFGRPDTTRDWEQAKAKSIELGAPQPTTELEVILPGESTAKAQ